MNLAIQSHDPKDGSNVQLAAIMLLLGPIAGFVSQDFSCFAQYDVDFFNYDYLISLYMRGQVG